MEETKCESLSSKGVVVKLQVGERDSSATTPPDQNEAHAEGGHLSKVKKSRVLCIHTQY